MKIKMSLYSQSIKSDIDSFQECVQNLSKNVQGVLPLWKDAQYSSLIAGISSIAMQAKDVIVTGDKFCEILDDFFKISEEEYN